VDRTFEGRFRFGGDLGVSRSPRSSVFQDFLQADAPHAFRVRLHAEKEQYSTLNRTSWYPAFPPGWGLGGCAGLPRVPLRELLRPLGRPAMSFFPLFLLRGFPASGSELRESSEPRWTPIVTYQEAERFKAVAPSTRNDRRSILAHLTHVTHSQCWKPGEGGKEGRRTWPGRPSGRRSSRSGTREGPRRRQGPQPGGEAGYQEVRFSVE